MPEETSLDPVRARIVADLRACADLLRPIDDYWRGQIDGLRVAADHVARMRMDAPDLNAEVAMFRSGAGPCTITSTADVDRCC